jgi:hypothetical protein
MPHAFTDTPLAELLPVTFPSPDQLAEMSNGDQLPPAGPLHVRSPEASFRIALTPAGQEHVICRQSDDEDAHRAAWADVPSIRWRYPLTGIKPAAAVLAYALGPDAPPTLTPVGPTAGTAPATRQSAAQRQRQADRRRAYMQGRPLLVTQTVGAGRVLMVGFDRTWRLRYRVGDRRHHRLWGQILRWATADRLPAGTDRVQLGTDAWRYQPDQPITVRARLLDEDYQPLAGPPTVELFDGDRRIRRLALRAEDDGSGLHEARLGPLPPGPYRLCLHAPPAGDAPTGSDRENVELEFSVVADVPAELVELTADRAVCGAMASAGGGVVVSPVDRHRLVEALGPKSEVRRHRSDFRLWDSWPLLVLIVSAAGAEWILRKKAGLP